MTPREQALAFFAERAKRNHATRPANRRQRVIFAVPPQDARALEVEPGVWEFYRVEREPSDLPRFDRWRVEGKDSKPGRVYLPQGSTAEDAWRRAFPRHYARLIVIDAI